MSNYPLSIDIFTNKTGADNIASSDPNNAFDGIEAVQGLIGALGEPQTWSTTLMTLIRRYKRGMYIDVTGGTLTVREGECVLENTNATKFAFRRNTGNVALGAGNIDVGTLVATTYYIYATASGAATTAPLMFSTDALAPSGIGTAPYRKIGWFENLAAGSLAVTYAGGFYAEPSEKIVNIVSVHAALMATGSTTIPYDNTVPLITEGNEYMTIDYVPSSTTNRLKIDVVFYGANTSGNNIIVALFQDAIANALRTASHYDSVGNQPVTVSFTHHMVAGSTAKMTFRVRAGSNGIGTTTFNGTNNTQLFNGVAPSSITITEYAS